MHTRGIKSQPQMPFLLLGNQLYLLAHFILIKNYYEMFLAIFEAFWIINTWIQMFQGIQLIMPEIKIKNQHTIRDGLNHNSEIFHSECFIDKCSHALGMFIIIVLLTKYGMICFQTCFHEWCQIASL